MQPRLILDMINGHRKSMVLFAAVKLGVFDSIPLSSDGQSAESIAGFIETALASSSPPSSPPSISREGILRLLHSLASLGLLNRAEGSNGPLFSHSEESKLYLTSSSSTSLTGYITHCSSTCYPLFQHLDQSIISGSNGWERTFGSPSSTIFENLYKGNEGLQRFLKGMHSFATLSAEPLVKAFYQDLRNFKHVVDLGGASGAVLDAWSRLMGPGCKCTVIDLVPVCRAAQEALNYDSRVQWLPLDFFDDQSWTQSRDGAPSEKPVVPVDVDCFVLTRIFHDWEESQCLRLLRKVHSHLPSGGGLLIGEMLLPSSPFPSSSSLSLEREAEVRCQDLNMLVQTRGRERSLEEYKALLGAAGFDPTKVKGVVTGSYLDATFVRKD